MALKRELKRKRLPEGASATFPQRVETLRKERCWTQAELARRLGVQRSVVANYEHGLCLPPLPMLERLAKVFEVSLDQLVFGDPQLKDAVRDRDLLQLFTQADTLDYAAKAVLKQVVEGLLAKQVLKKAS